MITYVAGKQQSDHGVVLTAEGDQIHNTITKNNTNLHLIMQELETKGVIGFIDQNVVSTFKHTSKLENEVLNNFGKIGKAPVIKRLYCM